MYRREVIEELGGFPEDVEYGEEPILCWKIRNELDFKVYQINADMAQHDLGYSGFSDYWLHNMRCGATYAEVATRCYRSKDPLWLREAVTNVLWATGIIALVPFVMFAPPPARGTALAVACGLWVRKSLRAAAKGYPVAVALIYGGHTYLSKIPLALGEFFWLVRRIVRWAVNREVLRNTREPERDERRL
jgi:hypothetical protein